MRSYRKQKGAEGERLALEYLEKQDYKLVEKNYSCKWGEIDLIVVENGSNSLVFVEVKFGYKTRYGRPSQRITPKKIENLINSIDTYLQEKRIRNRAYRLDVVEIIQGENGLQLMHYKNLEVE